MRLHSTNTRSTKVRNRELVYHIAVPHARGTALFFVNYWHFTEFLFAFVRLFQNVRSFSGSRFIQPIADDHRIYIPVAFLKLLHKCV